MIVLCSILCVLCTKDNTFCTDFLEHTIVLQKLEMECSSDLSTGMQFDSATPSGSIRPQIRYDMIYLIISYIIQSPHLDPLEVALSMCISI